MIRKLSRKVRGVGDHEPDEQELTTPKPVHPEKVFVKRSSSSRIHVHNDQGGANI